MTEKQMEFEEAVTAANILGIVAGLAFARPKWSDKKQAIALREVLDSQKEQMSAAVHEMLLDEEVRDYTQDVIQRVAENKAEFETLEKMMQ
jgi:hypothetical protein